MDENLVATKSILVNSSPDKIWDVLTNPDKIKIYLYGTEVVSDWMEGGSITFQGEYEGQHYKDKGIVIEEKPNELLKYSYWSGFSGLEDKIENYSKVSYIIDKIDKETCNFTWHQQGFVNKDAKGHTENGLADLLLKIKELSEK